MEGSGLPGEEFWFCFRARKVLGLLARSFDSASWRGRFWGSWCRSSGSGSIHNDDDDDDDILSGYEVS